MHSSPGFSLIELLVAIAMVGVLVSIAVSRVDPARTELGQAAQILAQEITRARFEAVRSNRLAELSIDTSGSGAYTLCLDESEDGVCAADEAVSTTTFGQGDFQRTRLTATTLSNSRIQFDRRGIPAENLLNGSITLEAASGNLSRVITLSSTGRAKIE